MTKIRSRDASRIEDRRGQGGGGGGLGLDDLLKGGLGGGTGGGGGGGLPIPGGMGGLLKGGGGIMTLLVLAAVFILPKLMNGGLSGQSSAVQQDDAATTSGAETCSTDLEQQLCGAVNNVSDYWIEQLPISFGVDYQEANTVFFSDSVSTGCGQASAQTGPFYCPLDGKVYFDLEFLTVLQNNFGATGDLAAQYIVAHEYGHHVQNVLGINEQMRQAQQNDPSRANQYSVALELQADCLAGAWARDAVRPGAVRRSAGDRGGAQRRGGRRRRPDPAEDVRPGRPRGVDPRLVGPARASGSSAASRPATRSAARRSARCCNHCRSWSRRAAQAVRAR